MAAVSRLAVQRVEVAGRHRGPRVVEVGQGVEEAHDRAQVGGPALVQLAALVVEHVGHRAVTREAQAAVPQPHVVGRVAGREQQLAWCRLQAAVDQLSRQSRGEAVAVEDRPRSFEYVDGRGRVVGDAHLLEHGQRLLVQRVALRGAEEAHAQSCHQDQLLGSRAPRLATSLARSGMRSLFSS